MVPDPLVASEAPVPTTIAALLLVAAVTPLKATLDVEPPVLPQVKLCVEVL